MRKTSFSKTAVLCGITLFFAVSAPLFAEYKQTVNLPQDGNSYYNGNGVGADDTVDTANVSRGVFYNGDNGGKGTVNTVNLDTSFLSEFWNGNHGGNGTVGTVIINDKSSFYNGHGSNNATGVVDIAIINDGYFYNGDRGYSNTTATVNSVVLNGGEFYNGTSSETNVQYKPTSATVKTVTMNGGEFHNEYGSVEHLIYNGGTYKTDAADNKKGIKKLTLGTQVNATQGAEFMKSQRQTLAFGADYGLINITGTVGENGLDFTNDINVSAPTVDLTGTKIAVNIAGTLASLGDLLTPLDGLTGDAYDAAAWQNVAAFFNAYADPEEKTFSLRSLFGASVDDVTGGGEIDTLQIVWGSGDNDWFTLINNGKFAAAGYYWTDDSYNTFTWALPETPQGSATPEPATLAIFGLGLAGLAALRRRKR